MFKNASNDKNTALSKNHILNERTTKFISEVNDFGKFDRFLIGGLEYGQPFIKHGLQKNEVNKIPQKPD